MHATRQRLARRAAALAAVAVVAAACTPSGTFTPPGADGSSGPAPTTPEDLTAGRSEPVADPLYPDYGNESVDVLHYGLNLGYDPGTEVLTGEAALTIRPVTDLTEVRLDLSAALEVTEAAVDGAPAQFAPEGDDLTVTGQFRKDVTTVVSITYSGEPRAADAPMSRSDFDEGLGIVIEPDGALWTMQEPYGAFTWYPVNDHPSDEALYDIAVTVPEGYTGVANGEFAGQQGNTYSWHSADPVASYLTTLAVDEFNKLEYTGPNGLPVTAWVPDRYLETFERILADFPEWISYLEERYGPYPFDSAGVVVVGGESAMETQQMITFSGDIATAGDEFVANVMVHELAHQWFGNAVTPSDWRGLWLNEGMATYADTMWMVDQGWLTEAEAVASWREEDQALRDEAGPPGDYDADSFASSNVYICSALMLYELREEMGDEAFSSMLRDWVQKQLNTHQDRESFTAWVNEYAGEDLSGFIDEWLDSTTTPA